MTKYVALLRAVNVAGHARISAADLVRAFSAVGALEVSSFGHAGNIFFGARRSAAAAIVTKARDQLERRHGERPVIVVRTAAEISHLVADEPFAGRAPAPTDKQYVTFLARRPRRMPDLPLHSPAECLTAFELRNRDVLLISSPKPNGFYGFPNAFVETAFGVAATSRNWSTITRLATLLGS